MGRKAVSKPYATQHIFTPIGNFLLGLISRNKYVFNQYFAVLTTRLIILENKILGFFLEVKVNPYRIIPCELFYRLAHSLRLFLFGPVTIRPQIGSKTNVFDPKKIEVYNS